MSTIRVPDTASKFDFEIHQGESWLMDFEVVDKNGAPVNTAGFLIKAVARTDLDTPAITPYFTWDSTAGSAAPAVNSATSVRLITTAAQTAAWVWRFGVYDVRVTDLTGKVSYIAKGSMTIVPASSY